MDLVFILEARLIEQVALKIPRNLHRYTGLYNVVRLDNAKCQIL